MRKHMHNYACTQPHEHTVESLKYVSRETLKHELHVLSVVFFFFLLIISADTRLL